MNCLFKIYKKSSTSTDIWRSKFFLSSFKLQIKLLCVRVPIYFDFFFEWISFFTHFFVEPKTEDLIISKYPKRWIWFSHFKVKIVSCPFVTINRSFKRNGSKNCVAKLNRMKMYIDSNSLNAKDKHNDDCTCVFVNCVGRINNWNNNPANKLLNE